MSLKKIEEKRQGDQYKQEDGKVKSTEKLTGTADKKLLSGTVQFYEEVLNSIPGSFIAVYNTSGKHMEVWLNPDLAHHTGLNATDMKGKFLSEVFDAKTASFLEKQFSHLVKTGGNTRFSLSIDLSGGSFNFLVNLTLLTSKTKEQVSISAIFLQTDKQKKPPNRELLLN